MGDLIQSISDIKDFFYVPKNYKEIVKSQNKELKFYFLNLEGKDDIKSVLDFLKSQKRGGLEEFNLIEETDSASLFYIKVNKEFKRGFVSAEAVLYLDKNSLEIILMSDEERGKINLIEYFFNNLHPFMSKKFIKSSEIIEIIRDFLEEGYFVTASMVSMKRWWLKVQRSEIDYVRGVPIEEVLKEIANENKFINSSSLNIFDKEKKERLLKFYISRRGIIKFVDGSYELFEEKILKKILSKNAEEKRLLKDRGRGDKELKPIAVSFEKLPEFTAESTTKEFYKSIVEEKDFSLAVMHNGNPYFHASVTDISDGSVFEIIFHNLEEKNELLFLPQYSVSRSSLSKFLALVFSKFGEGEIKEYVGD